MDTKHLAGFDAKQPSSCKFRGRTGCGAGLETKSKRTNRIASTARFDLLRRQTQTVKCGKKNSGKWKAGEYRQESDRNRTISTGIRQAMLESLRTGTERRRVGEEDRCRVTSGYEGFLVRSHLEGGYIKLHSPGCIHMFPQYPHDGLGMAVRPPTWDSGSWNTIVALFEGRGFRTCGVELATPSFRYETATKELTSWIHVTQYWLLVVTGVLLSPLLAPFSFSPFFLPFSAFSAALLRIPSFPRFFVISSSREIVRKAKARNSFRSAVPECRSKKRLSDSYIGFQTLRSFFTSFPLPLFSFAVRI